MVLNEHRGIASPARKDSVEHVDCLFTVDVEDWFHLLGVRQAPPIEQWAELPSRVENNFRRLLEIFAEAEVSVTCFFLGWIAEHYPHLVKEAAAAGHEIASHGYAHRLIYQMSEAEFQADASKSKKLIEDVLGSAVFGYRAAGFSLTKATPWFFDKLAEAGYLYDSSVFPAARSHGGLKTEQLGPYRASNTNHAFWEIPISVTKVCKQPLCFFGGGYFRLFPYPVIKTMARRVLSDGRPLVCYLHPREIDPGHPRLPLSPLRRFKSYVNLSTTEKKTKQILRDFRWTTITEWINTKRER